MESKRYNKHIITKGEVYKRASPFSIFSFYIGEPIKLNKRYSLFSKSKSCAFYAPQADTIFLKDFKNNQSYNPVSFVQERYGIGYYQALCKIDSDLKLNILNKTDLPTYHTLGFEEFSKSVGEGSSILYEALPDNANYFKYFEQFNIDYEILKKFGVKRAARVWVNGRLFYSNKLSKNPCFILTFPSGRVKIYRPLCPKTYKWRTNTSTKDVFGLHLLPDSFSTLFITSSLKDVMSLYSLGYNAIAFQSEVISDDDLIFSFIERDNKRVILFFDNDEEGIKRSIAMSDSFGIPYIVSPDPLSKDPSDFIKNHNTDALCLFIKTELERIGIIS